MSHIRSADDVDPARVTDEVMVGPEQVAVEFAVESGSGNESNLLTLISERDRTAMRIAYWPSSGVASVHHPRDTFGAPGDGDGDAPRIFVSREVEIEVDDGVTYVTAEGEYTIMPSALSTEKLSKATAALEDMSPPKLFGGSTSLIGSSATVSEPSTHSGTSGPEASETLATDGNVTTLVLDASKLDAYVDGWSGSGTTWDALPPKGKARVAKLAPDSVVVERGASSNATLAGFHDDLAEGLNPELGNLPKVGSLAVGTDDTTPTTADGLLGAETAEIELADSATVGSTSTFTYVIDSTEANGVTLREAGITSTTGTLWNRALLSPTVAKDNTKIVVVDIEVSFSNV